MSTTTLSDALVASVLARLQLPRVDVSADGLAAVFRAWCHTVPWDNVQKRITIAERRAALGGSEPTELFQNLLAHGTGGTCWPSAGALHALLVALGFDARRGIGAMHWRRSGKIPNHATTIVRVDGEQWLVDTSMLNERPLPLRSGRTAIEDAVHPIEAEPHPDGLWSVTWQAHNRDERIGCLIYEDDVSADVYRAQYEASRVRGFSYALVFAKGHRDGCLTIRAERTWKDRRGALTVTPIADRVRELVAAGVSEEAARRLPPDEPDPYRALESSATT